MELLDIVNENDHVIGQLDRDEIYKQKLTSFRVINAFLVNSKKKLWIPKRTKNKKLFPESLDASVGGHVKAGETYHEAFVRELKEELNIDANFCSYSLIAQLTPYEHSVSAFMHVYLIQYKEVAPEYNRNDFSSGDWFDVSELFLLLKTVKSKPDLIKIIKNITL